MTAVPDPSRYAGSQAVLIGVSAYEDPEFTPIGAARNSVEAMRELLTDAALCGWPADQVTVILNPPSATEMASRLADVAEQTTGTLLVYYVGHGVLGPMRDLCLTAASTRAARPKITGLPWETVREILRSANCPARLKLAILDCCFAGNVIDESLAGGGPDAALADGALLEGTYTLTATIRNRTAHHTPLQDASDQTCTSFTGELRDLVREGLPGRGQWLTLSELYPVLRLRLEAKGLPLPHQRGTDTADRFAFSSNAAFAVGTAASSTVGTAPRTTVPTAPPSAVDTPSALRFVRRSSTAPPSGSDKATAVALPRSVTAGIPAWSLTGHLNEVVTVAFSPDGRTLATGSRSERIWLWDPHTRRPLAEPISLDGASTFAVNFSPDSRRLAVAHRGILRLLDARTGTAVHAATYGDSQKYLAAFQMTISSDGNHLAIGHLSEINLWDLQKGKSFGRLALDGRRTGLRALAFSPNGRELASYGVDSSVRLWDTRKGRQLGSTISGEAEGAHDVLQMAFSPNGSYFATAGKDSTVRLWEPRTGRPLGKPLTHNGWPSAIAFSANESTLATAGFDRTVRFWDPGTGQQIAPPMTGNEEAQLAMAFSPNGTVLATAGKDNTLRLWSPSTGKPLCEPLTTHETWIKQIAFSPDSTLLATAGQDHTVCLLNLGAHFGFGPE